MPCICRAHAVPMQCPCSAHALHMQCTCRTSVIKSCTTRTAWLPGAEAARLSCSSTNELGRIAQYCTASSYRSIAIEPRPTFVSPAMAARTAWESASGRACSTSLPARSISRASRDWPLRDIDPTMSLRCRAGSFLAPCLPLPRLPWPNRASASSLVRALPGRAAAVDAKGRQPSSEHASLELWRSIASPDAQVPRRGHH